MKVAIEENELYKNGILLCKWFDLAETEQDEIESYVSSIKDKHGLNADDMELFVADVEEDELNLFVNEESLTLAYEVQAQLEGIDEANYQPIVMMLDAGVVNDLDEAIEHLEDMICTNETKMEDIAYNHVNECGLLDAMPSSLQGYFDYEALGRDMELNGNYHEDDEGTIWEYVA